MHSDILLMKTVLVLLFSLKYSPWSSIWKRGFKEKEKTPSYSPVYEGKMENNLQHINVGES